MDKETANACRDVGENLYRIRRRHGWSQEQVASRIKMKIPIYRRYETGTKNLTIETLVKLAKAIGVPCWRLLRPAPRTPKRKPGRPPKRQAS